jgi:alpha-tubulin suppressor-like RCC1 family protein
MTSAARLAVVALVLGLVGVPALPADAAPEAALQNWRQVSAGTSHTCAIHESGRLYCWGYDASGQLGDGGPDADQPLPVEVFGGGTNWAQVDAGGDHTCALKTTGRLFCWGSDVYGEVGDGLPFVNQAIPAQVAGGGTDWTAVSAGGNTTCARRAGGSLYCWGRDGFGQVGDGGGLVDQPSPIRVGSGTDWTSVTVGTLDVCGRRASGRAYCWGDDGRGQLGNGRPLVTRRTPAQVATFTDWVSVTVGDFFACGLRRGGLLYCWGSDSDGQLGNGGPNANRHVPTLVAGGATDWAQPAPGYRHSCGRRTSGHLYCWGSNGQGQVGNDGPTTQTVPAWIT